MRGAAHLGHAARLQPHLAGDQQASTHADPAQQVMEHRAVSGRERGLHAGADPTFIRAHNAVVALYRRGEERQLRGGHPHAAHVPSQLTKVLHRQGKTGQPEPAKDVLDNPKNLLQPIRVQVRPLLPHPPTLHLLRQLSAQQQPSSSAGHHPNGPDLDFHPRVPSPPHGRELKLLRRVGAAEPRAEVRGQFHS